jgi:sugar-specific transcriptional regulator TrmB
MARGHRISSSSYYYESSHRSPLGICTVSLPSSATVAIQGLIRLGFTQAEAEVYVALLRESPATGYRIATVVGKATANTYKALRSLTDKGAVLTGDGDTSLYRAVPIQELLRRFTRDFESQRDATQEALEELDQPINDLGVYRLTEPEQVLERAREMLARVREVALITAFPGPLSRIRPDIEAAAARGVDIGVKAYAPIEIRGVDLVLSTQADVWLEEIPGEELVIATDAEEHLVALFDGETVFQAIWSASPFLGQVHHNGMALEHHVTKLARAIREGASSKKLQAMLTVARSPLHAPGFRRLQEARRRSSPAATRSTR